MEDKKRRLGMWVILSMVALITMGVLELASTYFTGHRVVPLDEIDGPIRDVTITIPDLSKLPPGEYYLRMMDSSARIIAPGVLAPPDDDRCPSPVFAEQVKAFLGECVYNKLYLP